jgi:hypothetical protein
MRRTYSWAFAAAVALYLIAAGPPASAQATAPPSPSPSPSGAPAVAPSGDQAASPSPASSPSPSQSPFYDETNDIYSTVPDATLFYYFQGNRDGTAKVKQELRIGTTLWNDDAQIRIRLPYITKFPLEGNPYASIGNIEAGYNYSVTNPGFDHSLEARIALPTEQNGVESNDTQIKLFYTTKWKWSGWALAYLNEYDQTVIQPKGASYTSYYEGKLTVPDYQFVKGVKISAFYNYRVLFDSGGKVKDALGGTIFGNLNDLALSLTDSWGTGSTNALWKYKFEANATMKFDI